MKKRLAKRGITQNATSSSLCGSEAEVDTLVLTVHDIKNGLI